MTAAQKDQRETALRRSAGVCAICGKPLNNGQPQYAHKIANTQANRTKYGAFYIDHTLNGDYVCSLACNQAMNIGMNKGKCLGLMADILMYEMRKFENGR